MRSRAPLYRRDPQSELAMLARFRRRNEFQDGTLRPEDPFQGDAAVAVSLTAAY